MRKFLATRGGLVLVGIALLSAGLLAACSDDDGDTETATPTATETEAATETATAAATEAATQTAEASEPLTVLVSDDGTLGPFLTDSEGRTLYIFTRDAPGVSNCTGGCLDNWPPLTATEGQDIASTDASGAFGTLERDDGTLQVTYREAPLYYWVNDAAAGDATGHLVGGVWFVARPDTASTAVINVQEAGELAPYLVGPTGMTLYTFANDEAGVSNCAGACAENWPPLVLPEGQDPTAVDAASGELGVVEREDGTRQVTYGGQPLYYWVNDAVPGDTTGHEVNDVWFVATP
ncbi:MAG: hypothetical protein R3C39_12740 [Dehalococcoidia bacterium]